MKINSKTLLMSSIFSLVYPMTSFASLTSAYASLVDTSQNQTFESEPPAPGSVLPSLEPGHPFKLAAVHFITNDNSLNFGNQEFLPGDLCKQGGYTHNGCPSGYLKGEECPYDSKYVKECIAPDSWCKSNGYTVTSCSVPKYPANPCPYLSSLYKSCEIDNIRACKEAGYSLTCETGKIGDQSCPYNPSYKNCVCNPCSGYDYTAAQASAQGYTPGEVCNSCGTMKYKRSENSCDGYKACDCGSANGAKVCYSGVTQKFDSCKECCDSKFQYDSSNCTGGKVLAGSSCGGKYDTCQNLAGILYGDGTVSYELFANKTPIGIVFDPVNRLALGLGKDFIPYMRPYTACWSNGLCALGWTGVNQYKDVSPDYFSDSAVENCQFISTPMEDQIEDYYNCAPDGQQNTTLLLTTEKNPHLPVDAVNQFEPNGCEAEFCRKSKWFLPSILELSRVFKALDEIDNTLILIGEKTFPRGNYWSSGERSVIFMNQYSVDDSYYKFDGCVRTENAMHCYGHANFGAKYNNSGGVLPVIKY